ncbi:HNH endonuclease signature motif containing protein [Chromohalobacter sp.]|uniref:HNH endonuclease n=1 Tax=Chromohalobacter sp. TaxID=50740 RepID=UPI0032429DE7
MITAQYGRSPYVAAYAKRRAAGICELCEKPAPFITKDGEPYLECHHIEWLARGGEDTIENTVALCPNCHRKMHVLNNSTDITHLNKKTGENIDLQNQDNEPSLL